MLFPTLLLAALGGASSSLAQFVAPPTNLTHKIGYANIPIRYKEVPTGICELAPGVKSYSGYADVSPNEHLFFWFFEARDIDPKEAPLTVWINGGPGSSSEIGLFQEHGPCRIDIDGNVSLNPYSWNNVSNMLYIDSPTQVGFSYSIPVNGYSDTSTGNIVTLPDAVCPDYVNDLGLGSCGTYSYANESLTANTTLGAAPNMWKTIQGFMGAFPQYARKGFAFSTESYGGHYGPIFSEYIEEQNAKNISGAHKISLDNLIIGNGWYDPLIQYQAYYNFTVFPGNTFDYFPFNDSVSSMMYNNLYGKGNCVDQVKDCAARGIDEICESADAFCANLVEEVLDTYADRDEYDIRERYDDPFPPTFYVDYLNKPEILAAIGAYQNYSESNNAVGAAFTATGDDDRESGTIEAIQKLLKKGVYVTLYAGDADYNCNWLGGQVIAEMIKQKDWDQAGFENVSTSDGIVHGQVTQAGKFSFSRVYNSGHEVPFYQPEIALAMFERALRGKDIATGKVVPTAGYLSKGPAESTYREGNSTIQLEVLPVNSTYPPPSPSMRKRTPNMRSLKAMMRQPGRKFKP